MSRRETLPVHDSIAIEPHYYSIFAIRPSGNNLYPYFDTIDRVVRGLEYLKKSDLKSQEAIMMKMVSKHGPCVLPLPVIAISD